MSCALIVGLHAVTEQPAGHSMSSYKQQLVPGSVGATLGTPDGIIEGCTVGLAVGSLVGDADGS